MATLSQGSTINLSMQGSDWYTVVNTEGTIYRADFLPTKSGSPSLDGSGKRPIGPKGSQEVYGPFGIPGVLRLTVDQGTSITYTYSSALLATDSSGNVTGIVNPKNGATIAYRKTNNIVNPNVYGNGTLAVDIGNASLSGVTGSVTKDATGLLPTVSSNSLKFACSGTGLEVGDLTVNLPLSTSNNWIGFWATRQPASTDANSMKPLPFTIYFTANAFATFASIVVNIHAGTHYYVVPLPNSTTSAASQVWNSAVTLPVTITKIRIKANNGGVSGTLATYTDNAGATVNNYGQSGDIIFIGDFYLDPPKPRPKFLICFDDCKTDLVVAGGATVVDGTGATAFHSYTSFVNSYGFPVNAFIITGAVGKWVTGQGNYLDWLALTKARDEYNICFGGHSHTHPSASDVAGAISTAGLRCLGQYGYGLVGAVAQTSSATGLSFTPTQGYAGILTDLQTCQDQLNQHGFQEATKYLALPQGGHDVYVNQALEHIGYKFTRGVEAQFSHPWAYSTFNSIAGQETLSPLINVNSSIQTEGTSSQALIEAYVDKVITLGAIGSNYCHSWAGLVGSRTQTKLLCDYLKIKSDAGLIDVVRMDEI